MCTSGSCFLIVGLFSSHASTSDNLMSDCDLFSVVQQKHRHSRSVSSSYWIVCSSKTYQSKLISKFILETLDLFWLSLSWLRTHADLEQVVFKDPASSWMHKVITLWREILPNFSKRFFVLEQQSVGATLEQVFLAEKRFFGCRDTKTWFQGTLWLRTGTWTTLVDKGYTCSYGADVHWIYMWKPLLKRSIRKSPHPEHISFSLFQRSYVRPLYWPLLLSQQLSHCHPNSPLLKHTLSLSIQTVVVILKSKWRMMISVSVPTPTLSLLLTLQQLTHSLPLFPVSGPNMHQLVRWKLHLTILFLLLREILSKKGGISLLPRPIKHQRQWYELISCSFKSSVVAHIGSVGTLCKASFICCLFLQTEMYVIWYKASSHLNLLCTSFVVC